MPEPLFFGFAGVFSFCVSTLAALILPRAAGQGGFAAHAPRWVRSVAGAVWWLAGLHHFDGCDLVSGAERVSRPAPTRRKIG